MGETNMIGSSKWRRLAPVVVCGLVTLAGCSSGGSGGTLGNDAISKIKVGAVAPGDGTPLDAVPSPDGSVSYFTVASPPGIYRTSDDPNRPVAIDAGRGLTSARSLSISTDGSRFFATDAGAVVSLPVGGGQPAPVVGTEGTAPRGVEVSAQGGTDVVYFTGKDPADGAPAVFKVPAAGGARSVLAKGEPLVDPDGVAVDSSGRVFVTDHGTGSGAAYRLDPKGPTKVATVGELGDPGGLALTKDGSTLLVSSKNVGNGTAQVLLVDLKTLKTGVVDKVIGANKAAGGLHRAANANTFAWCDVSRSGRVYRVDP